MRRLTLMAAVLILAAGCNEPTTTVRGTVTTGGKPVAGVTLTFFPTNNLTFTADTGPDGTYSAAVTGRGPARVSVQVPPPRPKPRPAPGAGKAGMETADADDRGKMARSAPPPAPAEPDGPKLPAKYADPNTSGLTATLGGPETVFDIKLD